jgi:hypothetical protein
MSAAEASGRHATAKRSMTILIQADKLISNNGDSVTLDSEGKGYVTPRCKHQVNLDTVYRFEQAREDFTTVSFPSNSSGKTGLRGTTFAERGGASCAESLLVIALK